MLLYHARTHTHIQTHRPTFWFSVCSSDNSDEWQQEERIQEDLERGHEVETPTPEMEDRARAWNETRLERKHFEKGLWHFREQQLRLIEKMTDSGGPDPRNGLAGGTEPAERVREAFSTHMWMREMVLVDPAAHALLECLVATDGPATKGRNKKWRERMLGQIITTIERDSALQQVDSRGFLESLQNTDRTDGQLTHKEFYDAFVHPQLAGEDDSALRLERKDVAMDQMAGRGVIEILTLYCRYLSYEPLFGHAITGIVLFNCTVLAADYHGIAPCDGSVLSGCVLETLNTTCTFLFVAELVIKLVGMTPRNYVKESFNLFDAAIVLASLVELFMPSSGDGGGAISVFRALRILRILKAAVRFPALKTIIVTILSIIPSLGNFFMLLGLFIFFYATLGLHLWGGTYDQLDAVYGEHPRVNFDTFWSSILLVFQVLTGEDWQMAMYDTVEANGVWAAVFFVTMFAMGGYILLNLFIAVMLVKTLAAFEPPPDMRKDLMARAGWYTPVPEGKERVQTGEFDVLHGSALMCLGTDNALRRGVQRICRSQLFDNIILVCIMLSSVSLTVEHPGQSQDVLDVLDAVDVGFTVVFLIEMALKMTALGVVLGAPNAYLRNPWNVLDFLVVGTAVFARLVSDGPSWVKALRVLRALRPLRVITRVPELKLVVNSLFRAIPKIASVAMLLLCFWLVFGILGVQLFKGKLWACTDPGVQLEELCVGVPHTALASAANEGVVIYGIGGDTSGARLLWVEGEWGFDNILDAVVTLFEVSSLERWPDIAQLGMDVVGAGQAPVQNNAPALGAFFMVFVLFGSFFMLELFVAAIVAAYQLLNDQENGSAFQSERQRVVIAQMVLGSDDSEEDWKPEPKWQRALYEKVTDKHFENAIIMCISLNVLLMALNFDGMSDDVQDISDDLNAIFTAIFLVEAIVKITAMSPARYFAGSGSGWNRFDFMLVVITCLEWTLSTIVLSDDNDQDLGPVKTLRVFRIARIFRLFGKFKGLSNLGLAVIQALPTIMNVAGVLFLLFFMYAIAAMFLFGRVKHGDFVRPSSSLDFAHKTD